MPLAEKKTLSEWLFFLENRHAKEIDLGLTRMRQALQSLSLLNPKPFIITVAGTNGKGSTVALLESIYRQAGYAVASYISPHLLRFNERIRVNQTCISDEALCEAFQTVEKADSFDSLTYFEVTTLAALWYFQQNQLDLIILEVGMGGRLDAVNCIDPDLAIITTIDWDHQAYLGDTIEAIAYEKAGILRAETPFIYADKNMPKSILAHAESIQATPHRNGLEYRYELKNDKMFVYYEDQSFELPLSAYHPNAEAAVFIATICLKKHLPLSSSQLYAGIQCAFLPGRQQRIQHKQHGQILFDVAHNTQSVRYLSSHLSRYYPNTTIHAVFSALMDKDIEGLIDGLKGQVKHWYIAALAGKRGASKDQLMLSAKVCDVPVEFCYTDPVLAFQAACASAKANDLILVYGSFITVGLVLKEIA
jgi:dihydrofolate synthase/folylpolyglutamate synthase